jgi:flagellar basal-body rod protein FlgG
VLQGLYSAAAGMAAQQQRIDAVANDVANVSTPGYKRQRIAFRDLAYVEQPGGRGVSAGAGAAVSDAGRSQRPGALQATGEPLDVAILGDGYLQVRRPDGTVGLTRQGALRIDPTGQVVTVTGDRLVPPLRIPGDVSPADVSIAADGRVSAGARQLGRIALVDVPAPQGLLAAGNSVMVPTAASGAVRATQGATIQQGTLETSNVDMADAMTELMEAQRAFTLASRAVQTQDQLLEIANGVRR